MKKLERTRAYHLIDVENLYGAHHESMYEAWFGRFYWDIVGRAPYDLATVGADGSHLLELASAFPGCRHLVGRGADGADRALIDSIDWPTVERQFGRLVIASGDGCFVEVADQAHRCGLRVVVVSQERALSRFLRWRADEVVVFPEFDPSSPEFATAA
ncbi:MAG: hypothetical protein KGR18_11860 [Acidobacteria bacterium]|nr:hypothetical protein [Acidobacteriota bacterium]